jgi:hypothetical protein
MRNPRLAKTLKSSASQGLDSFYRERISTANRARFTTSWDLQFLSLILKHLPSESSTASEAFCW